jgi:hypothetical protein
VCSSDLYSRNALEAHSSEILGFHSDDLPWFYPPTFLLFLTPFALLPFLPSLLAWVLFNAAAIASWALAFARRGWVAMAALAFPSSLLSLFAGQNGGLTAGLLGGGLILLERRPVLAGVLLGLASFKPQMGFLVPFALIAGRCWKTFFAASVTFVIFAGASILAYGVTPWRAHIDALGAASAMVESGAMPLAKMVTVLSMLRQFGVPHDAATYVQYICMAFAVVTVIWVWRRQQSHSLRISILVIATFLAAPYAYFHDAAILALPLLIWAQVAQQDGWRTGEPLLLASFWLAPYALWVLTVFSELHIWPFVLLALAVALWRRLAEPQPVMP